MRSAIIQWFRARSWTFAHLLSLVNKQYDPLENYNRVETWTKNTSSERDVTEAQSGKDQRDYDEQLSGKDERDMTLASSGQNTDERSVSGDLTVEQQVSAYNSSSYVDSQKSTTTDGQVITNDTDYSRSDRTDDDITYGKKTVRNDDVTYGKNVKTDDDLSQEDSYSGTTRGNIGVMTTQSMFQEETALLASFNLYEWISKELQADLMLQIY